MARCVSIFTSGIADQSKQDPISHRHPLPYGTVADIGVDFDLITDFAGLAINDFAGFVIAQIQRIVGRDHGVAMQHETGRQRSLPQNRSVVGIDAQQRVQHFVLICFVGDVPHRLVNASAGDHRLFRHRAEFRIADELRAETSTHQLVIGLWVVVGTVIRMRPIVDAVGNRFGDRLLANDRDASRP